MNKKYLLVVLLCFFSNWIFAQADSSAQKDSLPYLKNKSLPAFYLLNLDSTKTINTVDLPNGRFIVFIFFSPDCDHCQKMTANIMEKIDSLNDVRLVFLSPMNLPRLKSFAHKMKFHEHKNIFIGKDLHFFFSSFYKTRFVPDIAIYDKNKQFVKFFEGGIKISELIDLTHPK